MSKKEISISEILERKEFVLTSTFTDKKKKIYFKKDSLKKVWKVESDVFGEIETTATDEDILQALVNIVTSSRIRQPVEIPVTMNKTKITLCLNDYNIEDEDR